MKYFKIPKTCQCRNTTTGLMNQSNKFYGFQHELVDRYEMSILLKWQWIFFIYRRLFRSSITDKTNTGLDCMCNMVGVLSETGTACHSREPDFISDCLVRVPCSSSF